MITAIRPIYSNNVGGFLKYTEDLKKSSLNTENKRFIENFLVYLSSKMLSKTRRGKLLFQSLKLADMLEKKYKDALFYALDRHKLIVLISEINNLSGLSQATKADYCRCLKQMYKWYQLEDPRISSQDLNLRETARKFYDTLKTDVKTKYKDLQINPNDVISEDDILLVAEKGCMNPKERAFVWVLHETGCRATEFLNLRIGDIDFRSHYAVLQIPDGKTGRRQLYIRNSVPALRAHVENHPQKHDKSAYLWVSDASNSRGVPLMHRGAQKLISRVFKRAGLNKKHNLHWFRHSRATILAPKLTEAMMCKYMGWVLGSGMIKVYAHLCTQDVENTFLEMHGLDTEKKTMKPQECDSCHYLNPSTAKYCGRCNKPLSLAVVISDQETIKRETDVTIKKMFEVLADPVMNKQFQEFLQSREK